MSEGMRKRMISKVLSAAVLGVEAYIVEVETHLDSQLPMFTTVGLPDAAVKESKNASQRRLKIPVINSHRKR